MQVKLIDTLAHHMGKSEAGLQGRQPTEYNCTWIDLAHQCAAW